MLVERLVRGSASGAELRRRGPPLRRQPRVVVRHLVVVPHHDEREGGVGRLQVGVELVERVSQPVRVKVDRLGVERRGHVNAFGSVRPADEVLVRVVAEVEDEVEVVLDHVAVRRVVAAREVLAGGDGERELTRPLVAPRRGAEVTDRALLGASVELVEVVGTGAQTLHLDVHGVGQLRCRRRRALRHHPSHGVVAGDPPAHRDLRRAEGGRVGRLGCQAGPQHDARRGGITGRDPQREWVGGEATGRLQRGAGHERHGHGRSGAPPHVLQEPAAVDGR